MIAKFRKGANSLLVRILLGFIALCFVGAGAATFINGNSGGDIVSFSDAESISYEEFQLAKAREIDALQRQNGINLTEENIAELGIDNLVLRRLISDSMISYLAQYYEFDISEDKVISYVKKLPFFKNDNGEFDSNIFKSAFGNSTKKQEDYLKSEKQRMIASTMLNIFMDSLNVPKLMTENVLDYMSETRVVDVVSADLSFKPKGYKAEDIPQEQLKRFYEENKGLFTIPETRSFEYIKADKSFIQKKLTVTEKSLKEYFEENIEDFNSKNFSEVKKAVKEAFMQEKVEELANELARNFEEDVASGLTLTEIANKYGIKVSEVKDITLEQMSTSDQPDYVELVDSVFEMVENELSYPLEIQDKSEILLVNLKNIIPARQQEFAEVENSIKALIEKRMVALENVKALEKVKKGYDPERITKGYLSAHGFTVATKQQFTRANLLTEDKWSADLLKAIFSAESNNTTSLVVGAGDKAYFAYVKQIKTDKAIAKKIQKNSSGQLANTIKEGIFHELISYLAQKNNMKIKEITNAN
ncbi:MAG: SurA N-terminal domain-containing protein [Rickettsiaceae bacterium]